MEEYTIKIERNSYLNILTIKASIDDVVVKELVQEIYLKLGNSVDTSRED
jgi:hypothetical protein